MLDDTLKTQLETYLMRLDAPLVLQASLDESLASQEMMTLLNDIKDCCPTKITINAEGACKRKPTFSIAKGEEAPRVFFAGSPMGHEFTSLILALLQISGYPPKISKEATDFIHTIDKPLHFTTYFSQSCQSCPDVVQALNMMAALNANITHVAIDGALFQEEVEEKNIMSVPTVLLGGASFGQGRMELESILEKIDPQWQSGALKKYDSSEPYDVLVVGAGPAGATAAIYAARKGVKTAMVSERLGGQVLDTLGIENFISMSYTEGPQLVKAIESHVHDYPIDVLAQQYAVALHQDISLNLYEVVLKSGMKLKGKTVILATGAKWREIDVPGELAYKGKGVAYCPHCDGPLFKGKEVAVIGGGNSGVEAAIDLAGLASQVTLIEYDSQLRADAILQNKLKQLPNINVIVNARTTEVIGDGVRVTALKYEDRSNQNIHTLVLQGVFIQIGLIPNTEWLKNAVHLSKHREIIVNEKCETNLSGIFGAGDVTTSPFKQIVTAIGSGATAALSAFDFLVRH